MQESIKYIDKFCKLNASRLKIGAIMKPLLIFFLSVTFSIEKILKEGCNIVAKRKIIPGYKNSDLSRSKEEAEKLTGNSNSKMMFLNKSNIVKKPVLCFNSCFA